MTIPRVNYLMINACRRTRGAGTIWLTNNGGVHNIIQIDNSYINIVFVDNMHRPLPKTRIHAHDHAYPTRIPRGGRPLRQLFKGRRALLHHPAHLEHADSEAGGGIGGGAL
ncbi:hypothetical protein DESC_480054 [Desulfosarcina cetonica]|nr:hypothetical protein DESC_480054 [Desulfosarcina cetonica]